MFIVSLIVCIILNVITVQPIYGADDSLNNSVKKSHAADNSQIENSPMFSDSITPKRNATAQSDTKSIGNFSKETAGKSKTSGAHNRGVTKTNEAPSSASSSSSNNDIKSGVQSSDAIQKINASANLPITPNKDVKVFSLEPNALEKLKASLGSKAKSVTTKASTTSSTTTTTTTTTTTATTSKPTTTTTSAPKKPLITYAVEDVPGLLTNVAEPQPQHSLKDSTAVEVGNNDPLLLESSETITYPSNKSNPNFLMAIIGIIVAIPLMIVVTNCAVRKVRDIWSKRKYRRMDYLIEDMYN